MKNKKNKKYSNAVIFVLTIDQIKEKQKVLGCKGELIADCGEGIGKACAIKLDAIGGVTTLSQEVVVLFLEPGE